VGCSSRVFQSPEEFGEGWHTAIDRKPGDDASKTYSSAYKTATRDALALAPFPTSWAASSPNTRREGRSSGMRPPPPGAGCAFTPPAEESPGVRPAVLLLRRRRMARSGGSSCPSTSSGEVSLMRAGGRGTRGRRPRSTPRSVGRKSRSGARCSSWWSSSGPQACTGAHRGWFSVDLPMITVVVWPPPSTPHRPAAGHRCCHRGGDAPCGDRDMCRSPFPAVHFGC
jgi:hypothetical protein